MKFLGWCKYYMVLIMAAGFVEQGNCMFLVGSLLGFNAQPPRYEIRRVYHSETGRYVYVRALRDPRDCREFCDCCGCQICDCSEYDDEYDRETSDEYEDEYEDIDFEEPGPSNAPPKEQSQAETQIVPIPEHKQDSGVDGSLAQPVEASAIAPSTEHSSDGATLNQYNAFTECPIRAARAAIAARKDDGPEIVNTWSRLTNERPKTPSRYYFDPAAPSLSSWKRSPPLPTDRVKKETKSAFKRLTERQRLAFKERTSLQMASSSSPNGNGGPKISGDADTAEAGHASITVTV